MVVIGGVVDGANVELHDTRFVVAARIEDAHEHLRAQWWGKPESLHLDAWGALDWADGHHIEVVEGQGGASRLWFVNLGGYDPARFEELHENVVVVADDERAAKTKALARATGWKSPHRDYIRSIETTIDVAAAIGPAFAIRLTPDPAPRPFRFETRYVPIGRKG